jgi:hypothetical protein
MLAVWVYFQVWIRRSVCKHTDSYPYRSAAVRCSPMLSPGSFEISAHSFVTRYYFTLSHFCNLPYTGTCTYCVFRY